MTDFDSSIRGNWQGITKNFVEGHAQQEDGVFVETIIAHANPIIKTGDEKYEYESVKIITQKKTGIVSLVEHYEERLGKRAAVGEEELERLQRYIDVASRTWSFEEAFLYKTNIQELREFSDSLAKLFSRYDAEKDRKLSETGGRTLPHFSFRSIHSNFATLVDRLELYLKDSFRFAIKEYIFDESGEEQSYMVGFDSGETVPSHTASTRALSADLYFFLQPESSFLSGFMFPGNGPSESVSLPLKNWVDLSYVSLDSSLVDGELLFSKNLDNIRIHRNCLFGDYAPLRNSLLEETARNLLVFFRDINDNFMKEYFASSSWEDFCSLFVRPAVVFEGGTTRSVLNKTSQSLKEKLEEDKIVYSTKEKEAVVKKNQNKSDRTDSGFIEEIKKDLEKAGTIEALYSILEKTRLDKLARASRECVGAISFGGNLPPVDMFSGQTPLVEVPRFSLPEIPVSGGASAEIVPLAVEQLKSAVLSSLREYVVGLFTVEKCDEWKKFFDKDFYERAISELAKLVEELFDELVAAVLSNSFLADSVSCYGPGPLIQLARNLLSFSDRTSSSDLFDGVASFGFEQILEASLSVFDKRVIERCGVPSAAVVQEVFSTMGGVIPKYRLEEILAVPPSPLGENSWCDTSKESFFAWLQDKGVGGEELACLKKTIDGNADEYRETVARYARSGGRLVLEEPFVLGDFYKQTALQTASSIVDLVFFAIDGLLVNYPKLVCSAGMEGVGASLEDADFLSSFGGSGLDSGKAKGVGGFVRPDNVGADEEFLENDTSGHTPFFDIYSLFTPAEEFQNTFFLRYEGVDFESECSFAEKQTIFRVLSNGRMTQMKKSFFGRDKHNKNVSVSGLEFEVLGGSGGAEYVAPPWYRRIVDAVLSDVRRGSPADSFNSREWEGAVFTSIISQLQKTFWVFLTKSIFKNDLRRVVSFGGDDSISFSELVPLALSRQLKAEADSECYRINSKGLCELVVEKSLVEAKSRRTEDQSVVRKIAENELSAFSPVFEFFMSCPFLWHLFPNHEWKDGIVSHFLATYFKNESEILAQNIDLIGGGSEFVYSGGAITADVLDEMERNFNLMLTWEDAIVDEFVRSLGVLSQAFSNFIKSETSLVQEFVSSLPIWQIAGRSEIGVQNSMNFSKRAILVLTLEIKDGGVWKVLKFDEANNFASQVVSFANLGGSFAEFSSVPMDEPKTYRASVNVVLTDEEITQGTNLELPGKVICSAPLSSVETEFKKTTNSFVHLASALRQEVGKHGPVSDLFYTNFGFGDIFELFQVFLFDLARETTHVGDFSKFWVPSSHEESETGQNTSLSALSEGGDTFGLLRAAASVSSIQKMALEMLRKTPYLIFKGQVEMSDPVIRKARKIVDSAKLNGIEKNLAFVALVELRPANIWLIAAKSPPITPQGILYLVLEEKNRRKNKAQESLENTRDEELDAVFDSVGLGSFCAEKQTVEDVRPVMSEPACRDSYAGV